MNIATPLSPIEPRRVEAARGTAWIGEGFDLFRKAPWVWVGITAIWAVISIILAKVPGLGLVGTFLNPIFQAGLMLGCAGLIKGDALRIEHLFAGFGSGRVGPLLLVGLFTLLISIGIVGVVAAVVVVLAGGMEAVPALRYNVPMLGLAVLLILALLVPLMMMLWFAAPLIVLRQMPAWGAMKLSFNGCLRNIAPFLLYGLVALLVLGVAAIPFFLGLLVALPTLIASVYISYRDVFVE